MVCNSLAGAFLREGGGRKRAIKRPCLCLCLCLCLPACLSLSLSLSLSGSRFFSFCFFFFLSLSLSLSVSVSVSPSSYLSAVLLYPYPCLCWCLSDFPFLWGAVSIPPLSHRFLSVHMTGGLHCALTRRGPPPIISSKVADLLICLPKPETQSQKYEGQIVRDFSHDLGATCDIQSHSPTLEDKSRWFGTFPVPKCCPTDCR